MSEALTWSTTAGSNNSSAPDGFPEDMPPSGVNNSAREVMAAIAKLCDRMGLRFINLGFDATVASNDLTVALKTASAANPATTDPVTILFRSTTVTTGQRVAVDFSAATSVVLPGGGSLGFSNSQSDKIHVWAVYDGTNKDIGVSRTSNHDESALHSTTTIGTGSDSTSVIYTTTGRTNAAITLIGVISIQYGTAAWTNSPTAKTVLVEGSATSPTFEDVTAVDDISVGGDLSVTGSTTTGSLIIGATTVNLPVHSTAVTASSTSVNFTGIPSWARKITVMIDGLSLSGTDNILIQIGDSGGLETSGYSSASAAIQDAGNPIATAATNGFIIRIGAAADTLKGAYTLCLLDSSTNTWVGEGGLYRAGTPRAVVASGSKSLSATLDRLSIVPTGSDTFDAGSVNIRYEY